MDITEFLERYGDWYTGLYDEEWNEAVDADFKKANSLIKEFFNGDKEKFLKWGKFGY